MIIIQHTINLVFTSNTYIISDKGLKKYWLIDVGDVSEILNKMPRGLLIEGVFLTHTHYDHIYGMKRLLTTYPHCLIYTSSFGKKALSSSKLNLSRYLNEKIEIYSDNILILKEGDIMNLYKNVSMEVFETPGHDKSCLTYKIGNNLFTGDSFIPNLKVITSFPNSNKMDAEISRQRILALSNGCNLYPGHGEIFENFQSEKYL